VSRVGSVTAIDRTCWITIACRSGCRPRRRSGCQRLAGTRHTTRKTDGGGTNLAAELFTRPRNR